MIQASEPVIVLADGSGDEALADVLIAVADQKSAVVRCGELHAQYPGLTLAVVICGDNLVARFRDGSGVSIAGRPEEAVAIARRMYRAWLVSRIPDRRAGFAWGRRGQSLAP